MSDTSGLSPIERLPNEILIEGFYFLKKSYAIRRPSHFLNIALVSRRFHSLSLEFVYLNLRLNCDQSFLDKNDKAMFETFLKYSTSVRLVVTPHLHFTLHGPNAAANPLNAEKPSSQQTPTAAPKSSNG